MSIGASWRFLALMVVPDCLREGGDQQGAMSHRRGGLPSRCDSGLAGRVETQGPVDDTASDVDEWLFIGEREPSKTHHCVVDGDPELG